MCVHISVLVWIIKETACGVLGQVVVMFLGPVFLYRAVDAANKRRNRVGLFGADLSTYPGARTRLVEPGTNKN